MIKLPFGDGLYHSFMDISEMRLNLRLIRLTKLFQLCITHVGYAIMPTSLTTIDRSWIIIGLYYRKLTITIAIT